MVLIILLHKHSLGSCGNSLSSLLGLKDPKQEQNVCTEASRHRRSKHWTVANNIIKDLVFKGLSVTKNLIGAKLYDNATKVIVRFLSTL